jgi:hypothetical protein
VNGDWELLASEVYDEGVITEVIRPAAIVPEVAARSILLGLAAEDVGLGGVWESTPTTWKRWESADDGAELVGTIQVAYGTPTRYDITIYRVTVTAHGAQLGHTVTSLCDEALQFGELTLDSCPRAALLEPPRPVTFD